jgi:diamine N-acetyltransferase
MSQPGREFTLETESIPTEKLPSSWTTRRVIVRDAEAGDVAILTEIFNANNAIELFDPTFHHVEKPEISKLIKRSQATSDDYLGFRLQTLRLKDGEKMCGYFHIFHGMPQPDLCWISIFVMHPEFQGQHLAQEVVSQMIDLLRKAGYRAIWLEVYLRNWPALRFWINMGFTTIVAYEGEKTMTDQSQARLLLGRPLKL